MCKILTLLTLILLAFSAYVAPPLLCGINFETSMIPEDELQPVISPMDRASCTMVKHNGTAYSYWSGYMVGRGTFTYFDPEVECGASPYPFQITDFSFTLYDPGGYVWPAQLDIVVYDPDTSGYICNGPTVELFRYSASASQAYFEYPTMGTVTIDSLWCVDGPFFIGLEYTFGDSQTVPSVLFDDNNTPDTCDNWADVGSSFTEWYNFWEQPGPGYPFFEIGGETVSSNCIVLTGACCYPGSEPFDNLCIVTTLDHCENTLFGVYQGDGSVCQGVEACCLPNGDCVNADKLCCEIELFGTPQGPGTSCTGVIIACCLPDGSCVEVDQICCDDLGGHQSPFGSLICLGDGDGDGVDDACKDTVWDHKMHYPQLPDETGWDVNATYPLVLADDWECSETGYVKDIHFWGSWMHGEETEILYFILSIHDDIPAGSIPMDTMCYATGDFNCNGTPLQVADLVGLIRYLNGTVLEPECGEMVCDLNGDCIVDTNDAIVFQDFLTYGMVAFDPFGGYPVPSCCEEYEYSRPGEELWLRQISDFIAIPYAPDSLEHWYDPQKDSVNWNDHQLFYRYDIYLDSNDWFWQDSGTVYWLDLTAVLEDTSYQWGWKSSYMHWNDDAVWADRWSYDWVDMYEPVYDYTYDPIQNMFWITIDEWGEHLEMGGTDYYGLGWYYYPSTWWNIWFYDHPYDPNRYKDITIEFDGYVLNSSEPAWLEFALNWSTDWWSIEGQPAGDSMPPLPGEDEALYIGRHSFIADSLLSGFYEFSYRIPDYNPEWVSIDVMGENFVVDSGIILHECKPKLQSLDLAFVITGEPPPPVQWEYHFKGLLQYQEFDTCLSGDLTVWGTVDCDTSGHEPLFKDTAFQCITYSDTIPRWANDILINFNWHCWCNNKDWAKLTAPVYGDGQWQLQNLHGWGSYHHAEVEEIPAIGDATGANTIYYVVDLVEWAADPRPLFDEYMIVDGECDDLPGFLIGTTPIIFDSYAPPKGSPFSTTVFTGTLDRNGELDVALGSGYLCGDANFDDIINVSDAVWIINYVFVGGDPPNPIEAGDANCDGVCNVSDAVWIINYVFVGGHAPCDTDGDDVPDC
jgi:Dockerin type I domain